MIPPWGSPYGASGSPPCRGCWAPSVLHAPLHRAAPGPHACVTPHVHTYVCATRPTVHTCQACAHTAVCVVLPRGHPAHLVPRRWTPRPPPTCSHTVPRAPPGRVRRRWGPLPIPVTSGRLWEADPSFSRSEQDWLTLLRGMWPGRARRTWEGTVFPLGDKPPWGGSRTG